MITLSEKRKRIYDAIRHCSQLTAVTGCWIRLDAYQRAIDELRDATPAILLTVFPPEKDYDGERFECKDYFSTMEAVNDFGLDTRFGDKAMAFLWDYMNPTTRHFVVGFMSAISDACRELGEPTPLESFFEENGLHTYNLATDAAGNEYLHDNTTGEVKPIVKPKSTVPRWWRVIEGGKEAILQ